MHYYRTRRTLYHRILGPILIYINARIEHDSGASVTPIVTPAIS